MANKLIEEAEFHRQRIREIEAKLFSVARRRKNAMERIKVVAQEIGKDWAAYHGDCIEVIKGIPDSSIHYTIFSPPFSSLFTYSASVRDMGNSTDEQFYDHYSFLAPEMFRITMPGRLVSIHCSDIPAMKERDGYIGLKDFPAAIRQCMEAAGFIYHSKVMIWKDPLIEATRTKSLGLMYKQLVKDSARIRMGLPDYIATFIKPGENPERIAHPDGTDHYIGEREGPKSPKRKEYKKDKYSHHVFQRYASPCWFDVAQGDTLNVRLAREKNDERHICPLQLQAIARCVELWSNPGDIVASWFAGIGSEGYQALKMGRRAVCVELKKSYYEIMVKNLKQAEKSRNMGLFKI